MFMRKHILIMVVLLVVSAAGCAYHGALYNMPEIDSSEAAELIIIRESAFQSGGLSHVIAVRLRGLTC